MRSFIEVNGKSIEVYCQNVRGQFWVHLNGRSFCYEIPGSKARKKKGGEGHAGDLMAPMPGKVTKIFKQAGDKVAKGEAIIVMEAMKMEYTLKSDGDGLVEKVNCNLGEQVALGKVLVHIKAEVKA